jgi:acetoin utilization deacetylase AcuC-like enzyme
MGQTAIVRDDLFVQHDPGSWHPESPARLQAVYRLLDSRSFPGVVVLDRREALRDEICLVHRTEHFDQVAETEGRAHAFDADTHTSPASYRAALAACGGLLHLTEKVCAREVDNGFALVRPPGHHAERERAMGFCLFNNVAVAAAWALETKKASRVLIVDWDLHHGNGTQHSFYEDPRVLYFSTHQYPFYPGTGALGECGKGQGLGYNINVPLSWGHGDAEYMGIFKHVLVPVARAFRPDLILVSAGFDIYKGDPLGDMQVTTDGFAALTRVLDALAGELCGGKLVITLEGGYHVDGQAEAVGKILDVLTGVGEAGRDLSLQRPPEPAIVGQVRKIQSEYWNF